MAKTRERSGVSLRPDKGAVTSARLGQTALSVPLPSVQTGQRDGTVRMRFCRTSGSGPVTQSPGVSRAELGSRTRSGGKWQPRAGAEECGTLGAPGRAAPAGRRLALRGVHSGDEGRGRSRASRRSAKSGCLGRVCGSMRVADELRSVPA